jgi:Uma2 family endonuclease
MPHVKKAELIEGTVYMPSPAGFHGRPHLFLATWLGHYIAETPGLIECGDNATVRLDEENEPQPDLYLNLPRHRGGLAEVDSDDYLDGPPTLACEVAASSVNIDLHEKLRAYRRNKVQEYIVYRTEDDAVDWLIWREGQYIPLQQDDRGLLKSESFPGLWLDVAALIAGDLPKLLKAVEEGTSTPEHADFVNRLK